MRINTFFVTIPLLIVFTVIFLSGCKNSMMKPNPIFVGTISSIELIEIQNKAINKPSRFYTHINLLLTEAYNSDGKKIELDDIDYPSFAGDSTLVNQYKVNDKVKIVCSSSTGRHIKSVEKVE
jgi:hypothetical protein